MTDLVQRYVAGCDRYLEYQTGMGVPLLDAMESWSNLPYQDKESWLEKKQELIVAEPAIISISGFKMYLRNALVSGLNDRVPAEGWSSMSLDEKKKWEELVKDENDRLI